jgi:hypothetical protein
MALVIKVNADTKAMGLYAQDLKKLSTVAIGFAVAQAMTDVARQAEREWKQELSERFTLRNRWTQGSIRSIGAKPVPGGTTHSTVGSMAPYLRTQEDGGTLHGKNGGAKSIPVDWARVGKSHAKLVAKPNQARNIDLLPGRAKSSRRRNASAITQATRKGRKYVFLEKGNKRGIFKLTGGKKNPKLNLVQTLSHDSVRIKRASTMEPAAMTAVKFAPQAYRSAFSYQLYRLRTYTR